MFQKLHYIFLLLSFVLTGWFLYEYIHGRLSEQFSGSQATFEIALESQVDIRKPEHASWYIILNFFYIKIKPKIVRTISAHKKCTVLIFRAFKNNIHLVTLFLYNDFFIFSNASLQIEKHFHETHIHFLLYTNLRSFVLSIICFLDKNLLLDFLILQALKRRFFPPRRQMRRWSFSTIDSRVCFFCSSGFCWKLERTFSYILIVF